MGRTRGSAERNRIGPHGGEIERFLGVIAPVARHVDDARARQHLQRTEVAEDQRTKGPKDQKTKRPKDHRTKAQQRNIQRSWKS